MSDEHAVQNALNSAYYFLKFRPRTKTEVERNLKKKAAVYKWSETVIQKTLTHLEEVNMINDRDFVDWFVTQRNKSKQKSDFALRSELIKLGVPKDLLDEYFAEHEQNEEELAYEALRKRWTRFQHYDKDTRFKKTAAFLMSRGFSFDVIKSALRKLEEETV